MVVYRIVTDPHLIEGLLNRMAILSNAERRIYRPFDDPGFTKFDFPFDTSKIYKYSIGSISNVVYNQDTHIVESFVVHWNPSWIHNNDTDDMKQLKQAYWTSYKTNTELLDIFSQGDINNMHNVRRILDHEFIYGKVYICPVYLVEWVPETINRELFDNVDYQFFAGIVQQYVLRNHRGRFNRASINQWFRRH